MALHIRIDCSSVYELIGSYMLFVQRKWIHSVENGSEWVRQVEQQLSNPFVSSSAQLRSYSIHEFDMLFAASLERSDHHDIELFLAELESKPEEEWLQLFAVYGLSYGKDHITRLQQTYIPLLREWHEQYFRWSFPVWEPALLRDVSEKQRLMLKMPAVDLIELATNGVIFEENEFDHEVILVPMWHYRPINNTCTFTNTSLVMYSVDSEEEEDVLPVPLKRMIHALSSDIRLNMLRYLSQGPITFSELVSRVQLGKSAVQHHLVILRAAGYIHTYWNGQVERIALRQEGLADLSVFLEDYIHS